jgi:hypothetical protein
MSILYSLIFLRLSLMKEEAYGKVSTYSVSTLAIQNDCMNHLQLQLLLVLKKLDRIMINNKNYLKINLYVFFEKACADVLDLSLVIFLYFKLILKFINRI